ncbi:MAG TPA: hypothetical protein VF297_02090 [Pyrinomonadaceae bacterium]
MNEDLRNFVGDLITLLQEKYNLSLEEFDEDEDETDAAYNQGLCFAYFDALALIRSQLLAFGYDPNEFKSIEPVLGKPV